MWHTQSLEQLCEPSALRETLALPRAPAAADRKGATNAGGPGACAARALPDPQHGRPLNRLHCPATGLQAQCRPSAGAAPAMQVVPQAPVPMPTKKYSTTSA